jgi:hypothetical protein
VRSAAAVVLSLTVKVRAKAPSMSAPPLMVEPSGLPVDVKVTLPPNVSDPEPMVTLL